MCTSIQRGNENSRDGESCARKKITVELLIVYEDLVGSNWKATETEKVLMIEPNLSSDLLYKGTD